MQLLAIVLPISLSIASQGAPAAPVQGPSAPTPHFQWSDFDGDARVDVAAVSATGELRLLKNAGDGTFTDVTAQAGLDGVTAARFVLWQDYDRDGRSDLFVGTSAGRSRLFRNEGHGVLVDVAETVGVRHVGEDRSAQWLDYDGDGRLDLHVEMAAGDVLYHALDGGSFEALTLNLPPSFFTTPSAPAATTSEDAPVAVAADETTGSSALFVTNVLVDDRTEGARRPVGGGGPGTEPAVTGASRVPTVPAVGSCAGSIRDQARLGTCLDASSAPLFGTLYPLGPEFNIDPAGRVGINTVGQTKTLQVAGDFGVRGNLDADVLFDNTGFDGVILARHSGTSSPITFELVEASVDANDLPTYGMFALTRRNITADGAGSSMYFEMPDFGGVEREVAGVGARIDSGRTRSGPVNGSLHFYTMDASLGRQDHLALTAQGNLEQDVSNSGLVKAACHIAGGTTPTISRRFNNLRGSGGVVGVSRLSAGTYIVTFGTNVASRFYQISLGNAASGVPPHGGCSATPAIADPNGVFVETYDSAGILVDASFYLLIY